MAIRLQFAGAAIEVGADALTGIEELRRVESFRSQSPGAQARWAMVRASSATGDWAPMIDRGRPVDAYRVENGRVELHPGVSSEGAFLVLRTLFSLAIQEAQGLLVHASCIAVSGKAALMTGRSGAGKSTIARWAAVAGATILSDEVVGVLPDGRVLGTPFFSESDLVGTPQEARLKIAATILHDDHERFMDAPAYEVVPVLAAQVFQRRPPISGHEVLKCLASATVDVCTGTFACRNAPTAGSALLELLA